MRQRTPIILPSELANLTPEQIAARLDADSTARWWRGERDHDRELRQVRAAIDCLPMRELLTRHDGAADWVARTFWAGRLADRRTRAMQYCAWRVGGGR